MYIYSLYLADISMSNWPDFRWTYTSTIQVLDQVEDVILILLFGVQNRFYLGIINAEEFVGCSHHVDLIGLALCAFLIQELINRLVRRGVLEKDAHDQKQGSAQRRRAALGDAPAVNIYSPGLVRRCVNTRVGYKSTLGMEAADIADFSHELGTEARTDAVHLHDGLILRKGLRQVPHLLIQRGQGFRRSTDLGDSLLYQQFSFVHLRQQADVGAGRGVDFRGFLLAETVAVFLAPCLVLPFERIFRTAGNTLAVPKCPHEIYPLFAPIVEMQII